MADDEDGQQYRLRSDEHTLGHQMDLVMYQYNEDIFLGCVERDHLLPARKTFRFRTANGGASDHPEIVEAARALLGALKKYGRAG